MAKRRVCMMQRKHVDAVLKFAPDFHRRDLLYLASGTELHASIATIGRRVVGICVFHLPQAGHAHIMDIRVDESVRREGLGSAILSPFVVTQHLKSVTVCVPESNLVAQLFFKANGFIARAIRKAVYRKSDEDGYVMVYGEMPPGGLVNWEDYCDLTESA